MNQNSIVIKTERLELRKLRVKDYTQLLPILRQPDLCRWTNVPKKYDEMDGLKYLKKEIQEFGKTQYTFAIVYNDLVVGKVGFVRINERNNCGEVGYMMSRTYRNKGIMTEACTALLEYGFSVLKLRRICINHCEGNIASETVAKKMGCRKEGVEINAQRTGDGKYHNHVLRAILREEWIARKQKLLAKEKATGKTKRKG